MKMRCSNRYKYNARVHKKVSHIYRIRIELGTIGVEGDGNVLCVVMEYSK